MKTTNEPLSPKKGTKKKQLEKSSNCFVLMTLMGLVPNEMRVSAANATSGTLRYFELSQLVKCK